MSVIAPGSAAPAIPGVHVEHGTFAVLFYKVTCETCRVAAPVMEKVAAGMEDGFVAVVQDPPEAADLFSRELGTSFPSVTDAPPYEVSTSYGIRTVPTLVAVENGTVVDVAESWDREGWNRLASTLGIPSVSHESDGLPPFRPG